MLHPRVLLDAPGMRESQLRLWVKIMVHHGGGEGGHYLMVEDAHVWHQMPHIILQYPYFGMDFQDDMDMVRPPREVFNHRGMMLYLMF
jgi:hypothetical protein